MLEIKILMVEDESGQRDLYQDAVDQYNDENANITLSLSFAESSGEAVEKLNLEKYDAVFLDLVLKGDSAAGGASGNIVLDHIVTDNRLRLIVYVVSGTLRSLDEKFSNIFENPLMRKFERENDTGEVISDLVKVWETGVTKILGGTGKLDYLVNEVFFKHLAQGFDYWIDKEKDCENQLLRYVALHLMEYLNLPEGEANNGLETSYFEPEFYISPPIKKPMATGDIIRHGQKQYVLLSPACDIALRADNEINVEIVTLAEVIPMKKEVFDVLNFRYCKQAKQTDEDWEEKSQNCWKSFSNGQKKRQAKSRFHYLPTYLNLEESVVDFKRVHHVPLDVYLDAERLATISSLFMRDIQSRFSAYYGRQGQPNGYWSK